MYKEYGRLNINDPQSLEDFGIKYRNTGPLSNLLSTSIPIDYEYEYEYEYVLAR